MTVQFRVTLEGADRLVSKLVPEYLLGPAVRLFFLRAALDVESEGKKLTPVDTGRLRASITHRLDARPIPRFAEVGTNVNYGPFVHEGRRAGSRMPPPGALAGWARRHGYRGSLFVLARAIARRGIKGRPFLRQGLERAMGRINDHLREATAAIEQAWRA